MLAGAVEGLRPGSAARPIGEAEGAASGASDGGTRGGGAPTVGMAGLPRW